MSNISASLFLRSFKHLAEGLALLFRSGLFGRGSGVEGEQLAPHSSVTGKGSIFFRRRILRRLVCLAIIAGLLIWPSPWVTLLDPVSVLASTLDSTAGENGVGDVLASLVDKLAPTASAQFNPWGDNPKAAQQIGTPPFAALEETRLGPVMPGSNFELPMPLVSLGGRGLTTSLMLYYNSNVWGAYFDPLQNSTVYAFDPIQSWPSPGAFNYSGYETVNE